MKVLLFNCSPHAKGCTYTALSEVASALNSEGIDTEIINIGGRIAGGCKGCGWCRKNGRCIIDDAVNEVIGKVEEADGYVFGSPVHYASASGDATAFMDRLFYSNSRLLAYKPGAAVVSARRAGTTAALDQMNKYFMISKMPVASSQYWNMVHGNSPEQVKQDLEGMQIMRTLGRNMAWLIKCISLGKEQGIVPNAPEQRVGTNFIR